jgi:hypothetical protein
MVHWRHTCTQDLHIGQMAGKQPQAVLLCVQLFDAVMEESLYTARNR